MPVALLLVAIFLTLVIPLTDSVWLDMALAATVITCISVRISMTRKKAMLAFFILTAAPITVFIKWQEPAFESQATSVAYRALNSELDIVESAITNFFNSNESALDAIDILVAQNPDVSEEQYHQWLSQVLPKYRNQFINIGLSKDLIIKYVYPNNETNRRVIGINQAEIKDQGILYQASIRSQVETIIGPVKLLQGMSGIIYVYPISDESGIVVSGVLSLEYLKNELESLIPKDVELSLTISTAVYSLKLIDTLNANDSHITRKLTTNHINVDMLASSRNIDRLTFQTRFITRFSAFAFWLIISLMISWLYQNTQIRESHRKALKDSEADLIAAQRLGLMGSWSRNQQGLLKLTEPLQELLHITTDKIPLEQLLERLHPDERESIGVQVENFFASANHQLAIEHRIRIDEDYHWFEHRIVRNTRNQSTGILRDINLLRKRDEQVALLESFDSLTGAANRHYFKQLIVQNIALCDRRHTTLALVLINIDNFRAINEKYGQLSGDELLKQAIHRLRSTSRKSDSVARLAGDTFAISLNDIVFSEEIYPQFTIGAAMFPVDGKDYDTLLRRTESALSNAKKEARGHYRFYSAELSEQANRRQKILASLPAAIRNNYLHLVFQPRVMASNPKHTASMETLLRWNDPKLGVVSPEEFIPIAEQTVLISDIGFWVMEHTFATIEIFPDELPHGLTISLNLSPRQLEDPSLLNNVKSLLARYKVNPAQFELEITEHSISEQSDAIIANMHQLSKLGFQFALDDFGTGYSNLSILQSLPLHVLKVDMSFIRAIGSSDKSDELVRAIVNMGHTLGLRVVAEGVESASQVQFLRELNCDELQGYYFFKPLTIEDLLPLLG
ncbi:MAG: bifunctional diguanylate cyclase/phosphodiesterase [Reinekea sp.]